MSDPVQILAFIAIAVQECLATFAVLLAAKKLSCIFGPITEDQSALALKEVVDPSTIVFTILTERNIDAFALTVPQAIKHVAFIATAIGKSFYDNIFKLRMLSNLKRSQRWVRERNLCI